MEPGAPGVPPMAPTVPEPADLYELLADGVAMVKGVPDGKLAHRKIPRDAWLRMSPVTFEPRDHDSMFYESVVNLPGVPRGLRYRDLLFTEAGIEAVKAEIAGRSSGARASQSPDSDLITLEDASLLGQIRIKSVQTAVRKHVGYRIPDQAIIARVVAMCNEDGISAWAALHKIPDDELAGAGMPDSRRRRILSKIEKTEPTE